MRTLAARGVSLRSMLRRALMESSGRLINIGHLLTGNLVGTLLGMAAFLLTARALGPHDYGHLALTFSYVRAVQLIVAFQSWQPLIKYGAELHGHEHEDDYRALMKFGLLVDVGAAATAFMIAVAVALAAGPLFGIDGPVLTGVLVYATTLLFQINGMPTAVLRLAGRFRLAAYGPLSGGGLRVVLCLAGLIAGAGPLYFIAVWTLTQIVGSLVFVVVSLIELHRQGVRRLMSVPLAGVSRRFKGLFGFTIGSNVELTVRASTNEIDTLIVGFLAGPTSAGLYHITKRLARMVLQIGVQVQAVLYPDIARMWAERKIDRLRSAVRQTELVLALFGVLVVAGTALTIRPVLTQAVGEGFAAAAPLAVVQMIAVTMMLSGSVMRSSLLAMGRQPTVLKVVIVATLAFHATAFSVIPVIGPMGANVAHVVMALIWIAGLSVFYRRAMHAAALQDAALREMPAEATAVPPGDEATRPGGLADFPDMRAGNRSV